MKWLLSFFVGCITSVFGCIGAGCVASLCVSWYRISGFEGGSGYFVVFLALLGLVVGLVVGIVCAAIVAASGFPGFGKGLGVAITSMSALLLIATVIAWFNADLAPTMDGHPLELAIEVRCPKDFPSPKGIKADSQAAYANRIPAARAGAAFG